MLKLKEEAIERECQIAFFGLAKENLWIMYDPDWNDAKLFAFLDTPVRIDHTTWDYVPESDISYMTFFAKGNCPKKAYAKVNSVFELIGLVAEMADNNMPTDLYGLLNFTEDDFEFAN